MPEQIPIANKAEFIEALHITLPRVRTKRAHRKSRYGCLRCKQRRVKCDEIRPSCSACYVRGNDCVYPEVKINPTSVVGASAISPRSTGEDSHSRSECSSGSSTGSPQEELPTHLDIGEAELFQAYFCHVAPTFQGSSTHVEQHWVWHVFVPSLAYTSRTVRYGILALAAMYLHFASASADNCGASNYVEAASFYGSTFMEQSRHQINRLDSAETDCNMICTRLLLAMSLAYHRLYRTYGMSSLEPAAWTWLHLLTGIKTVYREIMVSGQQLHPILLSDMTPGRALNGTQIPPGEITELGPAESSFDSVKAMVDSTRDERFDALHALLMSRTTKMPEQEHLACMCAVQSLRGTTDNVCATDSRCVFRSCCVWISEILPEFISILEQGHDVALVIYAHWLMLLVLTEDCWWVDDMGRRGIEAVLASVADKHEFAEVLGWPRMVLSL